MANQRPRRISDLKPTLTNLAQTSHYAVNFGSMSGALSGYLEDRGVDRRFITGDLGLLCNVAALPFASLATANVTGGYTGITEKFAHSRMYVPITLTFYVDKEYKVLKFLEHWMEFIAGGTHAPAGRRGSVSQNKTNYFIRMQYPDDYRMEQTQIIKFEKDYSNMLEYTFFNLFPQNVTDVQVGYDQSKILTASATFEYTRYVSGPIGRISSYRNSVSNNDLTVDQLRQNIEARNMNANLPDVLNSASDYVGQIDWLGNNNIGEYMKFYNLGSDTPEQGGLNVVNQTSGSGWSWLGDAFSGANATSSDVRLKENIIKVGNSPSGINIYEWNYKSAPDTRYRGVMAHEIFERHPEAVALQSDGYMSVYYGKIDVNMEMVK